MRYIIESELAGDGDGDFGGGKVACVGNVHVFVLHAEFHADLGVIAEDPNGGYDTDGSGFWVSDAFAYYGYAAVGADGDHFNVSGVVAVDTVRVFYYFAPAVWLLLVYGKLSLSIKKTVCVLCEK